MTKQKTEKNLVRIVERFHCIHNIGLLPREQSEENLRLSIEGSLGFVMRNNTEAWKIKKGAANVESDPLESSLIEAGKKN